MKINVLLFVIIFLFISLFTFINVDSIHDGILFKPALDVSHSKVLFKETFTQYGALTTFIQAGFLKIFGPYLLVLRQSAVFFYALTAVLLWNIWVRFLNKKFTLLSLVLWLSLAPFYSGPFHSWSSVYALTFQSLTILSLLIFLERKQSKYLVAAGASLALASWSRQPVGVYLFLAIIIYFVILKFEKKLFVYLFIGVLLASLPFFLYLIQKNALPDWWLQSFEFQREWVQVVRGISIDQIFKSLFITRYWRQLHLYFFWLFLPLSLIYLTIHAFLKKQTKLLAVLILSLSSWLQYYPVNDPPHFFWADAAMFGFFVYFLTKIFTKKVQQNIIAVLMVCLFILRIIPGLQKITKATTYSQRVDYLHYIRLTPQEKNVVDDWSLQLSKYLKNGKTYINTSGDPFVSLLASNFYPLGPMYATWEFVRIYPDYFSKVDEYVKSNHPLIVTRYGPFYKDYCRVNLVPYFDPKINLYAYCKDLLE